MPGPGTALIGDPRNDENFGHSQVRQTYRLAAAGDARDLFRQGMQNGFAPVTDAVAIGSALFYPVRGWQDPPQPTRRLDPRLR